MAHYTVLGIETSCDETAAAVVCIDQKTGHAEILSNIVYSQIKEHQDYGGVIPEFAARAHLTYLPDVVEKALVVNKQALDAVCATTGPGLIGGLHVGVCFAKGFAQAIQKPFIPINHLEGHALTACMTDHVPFPFLLLLISGGHTQIIDVRDFQDYQILGSTLDDSAGEVFDKTAKMMGLDYPGGPQIEKLALQGNADAFNFPKPLCKQKNCNFSFSGLKTAIRQTFEKAPRREDIAASLQKTVADILIDRILQAMVMAPHRRFVIAGGVAANRYIGGRLRSFFDNHGWEFFSPPLQLCTDNAAMIAYVGALNLYHKKSILKVSATPKWKIEG